MKSYLQTLAAKLRNELGLVVNVTSTNNLEKIVGGTRYETRDGIGMYEKKFEITFDERVFRARLPKGQSFIETESDSDTKMCEIVASHFNSEP